MYLLIIPEGYPSIVKSFNYSSLEDYLQEISAPIDTRCISMVYTDYNEATKKSLEINEQYKTSNSDISFTVSDDDDSDLNTIS